MKKLYTLLSMLCVGLALCLTSCDDDYYTPYPNQIDKDLLGTWELYSADGNRVYDYQVNWLEFNRNGQGYYYYYDDGRQYSMWLDYTVRYYGGGNQLYIEYQDGSSVSMNYWFNSNATYLYTQWYENGRSHTYTYRYVSDPSFASHKAQFEKAASGTPVPAFAPGIITSKTETE